MNNIEVNKAIEDLALIKRAIEQSQRDCDASGDVRAGVSRTHRLLNCAVFIMASLFFLGELVLGNINTKYLLASESNNSLMIGGLLETGAFLALLLIGVYVVIFEASRKAGRDFNYYLGKNFAYLKNLSLFSDLLLKYIIFCLIVIAGRPEWIAPLFFFFLGDYLINGRVFYLPARIGVVFGAACFAAGLVQIFLGSSLLLWPLLMVVGTSLLSIIWSNQEHKNLTVNNAK